MAADLVFLLILFYSVVFGARRGFYKEVIQTLALLGALLLARYLHGTVGGSVASALGVPEILGEIAGGVVVFVVGFLVIAIVGRLILKKVKGQGADDRLDDGAEAVADAIAGDTKQGPVTLLTNPIAGKNGIVYWSDKILGAGLGFVKGCVTGLLLFGVIVYADRCGWTTSFARSIEASHVATLYKSQVEPYLESYPEFKIVRSLDEIWNLSQELETQAQAEQLRNHPELQSLKNHPKVQELLRDPDAQAAFRARDVKTLLQNPKVRALLADDEFRARLGEVDWSSVRADINGLQPQSSGQPEAGDDEAAPR
ncbi:MAG: CvpA family protein [Planctomycetota bacterium]